MILSARENLRLAWSARCRRFWDDFPERVDVVSDSVPVALLDLVVDHAHFFQQAAARVSAIVFGYL